MLKKSGFGDVTTLLGGLPAWQQAGYQVATGDGETGVAEAAEASATSGN